VLTLLDVVKSETAVPGLELTAQDLEGGRKERRRKPRKLIEVLKAIRLRDPVNVGGGRRLFLEHPAEGLTHVYTPERPDPIGQVFHNPKDGRHHAYYGGGRRQPLGDHATAEGAYAAIDRAHQSLSPARRGIRPAGGPNRFAHVGIAKGIKDYLRQVGGKAQEPRGQSSLGSLFSGKHRSTWIGGSKPAPEPAPTPTSPKGAPGAPNAAPAGEGPSKPKNLAVLPPGAGKSHVQVGTHANAISDHIKTLESVGKPKTAADHLAVRTALEGIHQHATAAARSAKNGMAANAVAQPWAKEAAVKMHDRPLTDLAHHAGAMGEHAMGAYHATNKATPDWNDKTKASNEYAMAHGHAKYLATAAAAHLKAYGSSKKPRVVIKRAFRKVT
jgi:hypothetical protein